MQEPKHNSEKEQLPTNSQVNLSKGLDDWNDRLENNLEKDDENDPLADEKAKRYSEGFDRTDQSSE